MVEGIITDREEPYVIKLTRSTGLRSSGDVEEAGAKVTVIDSKANSFFFTEGVGGLYRSNPGDFQGVVGETYYLEVERSNGERYRSTPVLLKPASSIDSIYFERDIRLTDTRGDTLDGIRILLDSHDSTSATKFYRFEWEETYEIRPLYPSYYVYDFSSNLIVERDTLLNLCYNTNTSTNILVADVSDLNESRVSQYELKYVNTEDYHLRSLYSILVRQFTLDEKGFRYWKELEKMSESLGTIFDPIQYPLYGNVRNINDPEEPVLGYFDASAFSQRRLYVSSNELTDLRYPRDPCINKIINPRPGTDDFLLFIRFGYMIVDVIGVQWAPPECADCRKHGTLERPAFWPR